MLWVCDGVAGTLGIKIERQDETRAFLQCEASHFVLQLDGHGRHDGGGPMHFAFCVTELAFDRIVDRLKVNNSRRLRQPPMRPLLLFLGHACPITSRLLGRCIGSLTAPASHPILMALATKRVGQWARGPKAGRCSFLTPMGTRLRSTPAISMHRYGDPGELSSKDFAPWVKG